MEEHQEMENIPEVSPKPEVTFPSTEKQKRKSSKKIFIVFLILIAIGLMVGVWFIFKKPGSPEPSPTPAATLTPYIEGLEATPASSPEPADKSLIKIRILNGTGISGEAAFLQGHLKGLGYSEIELGNADEQNYTITNLTFSSSLSEEIVDEVTDELLGLYKDVNTKKSASLEEEDILITTGLRKGATPKPTASPSPEVTPTASPGATPTG